MASDRRRTPRRGFTLVELLLAGMIAAMVLVTVVVTLSQIGRAREVSRARLLAHLRADAALDAIRGDLTSVLRDADLFHSRVLLYDGSSIVVADGERIDVGRDEVLVFNTRLQPLGEIDYNGEGGEYETQFRIDEDQFGVALWERRDPVPDDWPDGGGVATPIAEGVIGIDIMAYDGQDWFEEWDSDVDGLPWGFRVEVISLGNPRGDLEEIDPKTLVVLRTHVSIDRIIPPYVEPDEEDEEGMGAMGEGDEDGVGGAGGAGGAGAGGFGGKDGGPGGIRAPGGVGSRGGSGGRGGSTGGRGFGGGGRPGSGGGRPGNFEATNSTGGKSGAGSSSGGARTFD
ncbi:MAG: hypothetical protein CMJ34_03520 [Phycisphaerae bacterium]|nr:hypothetical protein [Phycisphaerae bacterium]